MRSLKTVLSWILMIAGAATLILWYFTDLMNWNVFGWLSWLLIAIGGWLMSSTDENDSLFKLLVAVAAADGELSPKENAMLSTYAQKFGISNKAVGKLIKEFGENPQINIPDSEDKKKKQLNALIDMAKADGKVDADELTIIKVIAQKFGFNESYVDQRI